MSLENRIRDQISLIVCAYSASSKFINISTDQIMEIIKQEKESDTQEDSKKGKVGIVSYYERNPDGKFYPVIAFEDKCSTLLDGFNQEEDIEVFMGGLDAGIHWREKILEDKQNKEVIVKQEKQEKESDEKKLRYWLWLKHGHPESLYGDDGEMQCSECMLDFKRDGVEKIDQVFRKQAEIFTVSATFTNED